MKILVSDEVSKACLELFRKPFEVHYKTGLSESALGDIVGAYDAWIVRSATKVTASLIAKAHRLRIIGRAGAGVDNIDVDAATRRGVIVMNTPGGNTLSTAEHTIAMILALARNIPQARDHVRRGEWKRSAFTGTELHGKTLGILGLGKVGREVGYRMKSFGMQLIGFDPLLSEEEASRMGIRLVPFEALLKTADFVTIHTPLNKATENLIDAPALAMCRKGVRIINCARGGIVNEAALAAALQDGRVAGAALDVLTTEPPPKTHALLALDNVIVTPHLGASTEEAQEKVAIQIAEQVIDALEGRVIRGAINLMPIDSATLRQSEPYLNLASRLGSLAAQITPGSMDRVRINYFGDVLHHPISLMTATILAGMFAHRMDDINLVNASAVAQAQGIDVSETRSTEHHDFTNVITIEVHSGDVATLIGGALFGKNDPRVVFIDDFVFDSKLDGTMLILSNEDRPGQIGKLGTILGNHRINIAQMSLGRKGMGGRAMTILNLDQAVTPDVVAELTGQGFYDIRSASLTGLPRAYPLPGARPA